MSLSDVCYGSEDVPLLQFIVNFSEKSITRIDDSFLWLDTTNHQCVLHCFVCNVAVFYRRYDRTLASGRLDAFRVFAQLLPPVEWDMYLEGLHGKHAFYLQLLSSALGQNRVYV